MSQLRHCFRLTVDGQTHTIVTSARDLAAIETDQEVSGTQNTFLLMHAACMRLKVPGIPADVEDFIDVLDEFEDMEGGTPAGVNADEVLADPTLPAA